VLQRTAFVRQLRLSICNKFSRTAVFGFFTLPQYLVFIRAGKESLPSSRLATVAWDRPVESSHCSRTVFTLYIPCVMFISPFIDQLLHHFLYTNLLIIAPDVFVVIHILCLLGILSQLIVFYSYQTNTTA